MPIPTGWEILPWQPSIPQGGRANTIAVSPSDDSLLLVASESGGLFRSTDQGRHWAHLDGLPAFVTTVAFLPDAPGTVVAGAHDDFRVVNGGGIWRSEDGGASWAQAPPPPAPPLSARFSADEISVAPDTGAVNVATSYGICVSVDQGRTWDVLPPVFAVPGGGKVVAVLALGSGLLLAGGPGGVRRSEDAGSTWTTPATPPGAVQDVHAFGRCPTSGVHAYVVTSDRHVHWTEDGGDHWTWMSAAAAGNDLAGGIGFVKAVRAPASPGYRRADLDLYFGNKYQLQRLRCPMVPGTDRHDYSGAWQVLAIDHVDTRDLAFDSRERPLLLATDGGVHTTPDDGSHWELVGGGSGRFTALQIYEARGQWVDDVPRYDLYFGTQDNRFWCSGDEGSTWDAEGAEGAGIDLLPRVATGSQSLVTFDDVSAAVVRVSGPLFTDIRDWPAPPARKRGSLVEAPRHLGTSVHVQGVDASPGLVRGFAVTLNRGASWTQYATLAEDCLDLPKVARDAGTPPRIVLYQPVRVGYDTARGIDINHLARLVQEPSGTTATTAFPAMKHFGGLGIHPGMFAYYQVFDADPENVYHLIAADTINGAVMETWTGGDDWQEMPELTALVTDNGALHFAHPSAPIFTQVTAISFCPYNPHVVAVGTWEAGVFVSVDRGATWSPVQGSVPLRRVSSFAWRAAGDVFVSTYGQGLWRLRFIVLLPDVLREKYCKDCEEGPPVHLPPHAPKPGPPAMTILAFDGHLQGLRAEDGVLREVFVRPGTSVLRFSDLDRTPEVAVRESADWVGFHGMTVGQGEPPAATRPLVGVRLDASWLPLTLVSAPDLLTMQDVAPMNDEWEPVGAAGSPAARRPYLEVDAKVLAAGEPVRATGRRFRPGSAVALLVDGRAEEELVVDPGGGFAATLALPHERGLHQLVATEAGTRTVIDGVTLVVASRDAPQRS